MATLNTKASTSIANEIKPNEIFKNKQICFRQVKQTYNQVGTETQPTQRPRWDSNQGPRGGR